MEQEKYDAYVRILKKELVPALGCTEPIALAYCAAVARKYMTAETEKLNVYCSGNIIKNVKSVTVPNSGGMHGIEAAAILGYVGGDADAMLEVLQNVTEADIKETERLLKEGFCTCFLEKDVANLYIRVEAVNAEHSALVEIVGHHTEIRRIEQDGKVVYSCAAERTEGERIDPDKALLNVKDILTFADEVNLEDVRQVLEREIEMNMAIAEEGMRHPYGAEIGRTLLQAYGEQSVNNRAKAKAAAGSDARMNGCALPVVINSGSGNQGITCSVPVIEYAMDKNADRDKLLRALCVSNLVAIHQKKYIGSLSAYCGAVSAGCGAGAGISYLCNGDYEQISETITNTIATLGGVICDGAKSSCAAKIAAAVESAILGNIMAQHKRGFLPGEGLVGKNVEGTIENLGYVGKVGMKTTDEVVLGLMIKKGDKTAG